MPPVLRQAAPAAVGLVLLGVATFAAGVARADEPDAASTGDGSTVGVLVLILGVGAAYLLAHAVVDRMQRRFLVLSGAEYVLLGTLIGPVVAPGLRAFERLDPVLPLVTLAAGWVGLLRGMELRLRDRDVQGREEGREAMAERGSARLALGQAIASGALVAAGAWAFFRTGVVPATDGDAALGTGVLACAAAAASLRPIEVIADRYQLAGGLSAIVRRVAALSDLVAIVAFGVLICVFHPHPADAPASASPTEWVVISAGLGVALGVLFTPFLGGDDSDQGRFLALVGIITFASGAAYFLQISPIFVNLCLGAVLVNTSRAGPQIRRTLESTRGPMGLILLVFAGALFRPPPLVPTLALTLGFVVLRLLGKVIGSRIAARGTELRRDLHRGVLAHGDVTVAIAVAYRVFHLEGDVADVVFASVLASCVLHDLVAPRVLRSLLVDAGDIRAESAASASATPTSPAAAGAAAPTTPALSTAESREPG